MGFFSAIGNFFCFIGRGIKAIFKGIFGGIFKIFTREWTVIDSHTYEPITNRDGIMNDSRGPTPLDPAPTPERNPYTYNNESYGYGYTSYPPTHVKVSDSAAFLKNLYHVNPDVINDPRYQNYDVYSDPYHGYGTLYGPMFNPELSNHRFDMFGRRYDDTPLVDENILHHHPPYANLNPFSSYDQPVFSSYPRNDYWNDNNQYIDAYGYTKEESDASRAYKELLVDKERDMWSDDYIESLDKYIWEEDHGYSRVTTPEIDYDINRRRKELESGTETTYIPENYVGNVI